MGAWVGLVPALLVVLYAGWCGNLLGGVTAAGSTTALAVLLLVVAVFAGPWRDPLRLGRLWRLAPLGLWVAVAASAWLSPVPRAGLEAVVLLPAYLLLPGAVARCWEGDAARRLGARGMAAAVALLAAWALVAERGEAASRFASDDVMGAAAAVGGRPAAPGLGVTLAPLGHHTLLAVWLATLLPLALLPLRERNAWRWLGAGAGALGIAAVLAGGSLAGGAALAGEALAVAWWLASRRPAAGPPALLRGKVGAAVALAAVGLLLAASQLPRLARIASRQDVSSLARAVYLRAGWQGWRERPWLGWGPGSVPWTAAWFIVPRPGINPWGEAVGELHSLPVQLAYEIGTLGLLTALATGGAFLARRWPERRTAADPGLLAAGCL
ncbi:MAG TPA: O-antigen ligase family protein, partial [Thermoanaerobaculia bacterium]|nr:O-antigen ligase family protein [Thermoanaerobaculia bacterium]